MNTLPTWAQSSVDPTQVSKTVEGALIALSSIVLLILSHFGFSLTQDQYIQAVSNVTQIVFVAATAWGALQSLFGIFRKGVASPIVNAKLGAILRRG